MKKFILTNNPLTKSELSDLIEVELLSCTYLELLTEIRDRVHTGVKILTHPLSGSIKPNETPFKSVMLETSSSKTVDFQSLQMIEDSIVTTKKFAKKEINMTERIINDFQVIDTTLIRNAVLSAIQ